MPKLVTGQSIASAALALGAVAAGPTVANAVLETSPIIGISLLYGIMMFASSYVEEEQHFWYWATTAWLMLLWVKWSVYTLKFEPVSNFSQQSQRCA